MTNYIKCPCSLTILVGWSVLCVFVYNGTHSQLYILDVSVFLPSLTTLSSSSKHWLKINVNKHHQDKGWDKLWDEGLGLTTQCVRLYLITLWTRISWKTQTHGKHTMDRTINTDDQLYNSECGQNSDEGLKKKVYTTAIQQSNRWVRKWNWAECGNLAHIWGKKSLQNHIRKLSNKTSLSYKWTVKTWV